MTIDHLVQTLIQRFGWQLESHRPEAVERALQARTLKLGQSSVESYLKDLSPNGPEFNLLLEELVVPESWFYRERETLALMLEKISLNDYSDQNPLRILCIPCARGEEPSTIAMMLHQSGLATNRRKIEAVDLSQAAIDSATLGQYRAHSFRGNHCSFRDQFFKEILVDLIEARSDEEPGTGQTQKSTVWQLQSSIQKSIEYAVQNIFELPERYGNYDIVLCRHLLIYLTPSARDRLFEIVSQRLKPNGLFVVAACEFALPPSQRFTPISREGIVLFKNQPAPAVPVAPTNFGLLQNATAIKPPLLKSQGTNRLHSNPSKDRHSLASPKRLESSTKMPEPSPAAAPTGAANKSSLLEQAKAEADLGRLHSALELTNQVLSQKPAADAYCLQGVIQSALNDKAASEASFRKALYLDPDNKEALTQLALAKEAAGEIEAAKRLRERLNR